MPCLAPSEVVGDEHAEEDGQHAAGLAGEDGCPQRPVLLDQAGHVVLAGGASLAAGPARQPGPPVRPRHAPRRPWGQSDSQVKSPCPGLGGAFLARARAWASQGPGPHSYSHVSLGEMGTPGLGTAPTCPGTAGSSAGPVKARLAPAQVPPEDEATAFLGDTLKETG